MKILFEDKHCLVVYKPARLLTASDKTGDETLIEKVRVYNASKQAEGKKGFVAPLHMLDRPVSGLVMFAVSSKAASRLAEQMRHGKIEKVYQAVVEGRPKHLSGELSDWLLKDPKTNLVKVVAPGVHGAKACRLLYRFLGSTEQGCSVLEIRPKTGRSHQIRVQLAAQGLSILGDRKYGSQSTLWGQKLTGIIALHAWKLAFVHPVSKENLTIEAPLPDYFPQSVAPISG